MLSNYPGRKEQAPGGPMALCGGAVREQGQASMDLTPVAAVLVSREELRQRGM